MLQINIPSNYISSRYCQVTLYVTISWRQTQISSNCSTENNTRLIVYRIYLLRASRAEGGMITVKDKTVQ